MGALAISAIWKNAEAGFDHRHASSSCRAPCRARPPVSSMISATSRTCSALSALGSATACTAGPIAASRSRTVIRNGRLRRTTTSAPPRETSRRRLRHQRAGALLLGGGDAVLEIEDDRVGAAPRRALDKAPLRDRHEQHRTPDREILSCHRLRAFLLRSTRRSSPAKARRTYFSTRSASGEVGPGFRRDCGLNFTIPELRGGQARSPLRAPAPSSAARSMPTGRGSRRCARRATGAGRRRLPGRVATGAG